ncbi:MAG: hypothetical protein AAF721_42390, partial [Myxococcota bacterium]
MTTCIFRRGALRAWGLWTSGLLGIACQSDPIPNADPVTLEPRTAGGCTITDTQSLIDCVEGSVGVAGHDRGQTLCEIGPPKACTWSTESAQPATYPTDPRCFVDVGSLRLGVLLTGIETEKIEVEEAHPTFGDMLGSRVPFAASIDRCAAHAASQGVSGCARMDCHASSAKPGTSIAACAASQPAGGYKRFLKFPSNGQGSRAPAPGVDSVVTRGRRPHGGPAWRRFVQAVDDAGTRGSALQWLGGYCFLAETNCDDGKDNDHDGYPDCADPDCGECGEAGLCGNDVDDDNDGLTDCADLECGTAPECFEDCSDGFDNDGDGHVDCGDDYCDTDPACNEAWACLDMIDNDGD